MQDWKSIIYGPVSSRRFGQSLGINLLGEKKVCSFDCPYCDLGPSEVRMNQIKRGEAQLPTRDDIAVEFRKSLMEIKTAGKSIDTIAISGNGEPTLHPDFSEIVADLIKIRNDLMAQVPMVILSNGANLDNKKIVAAMNELNERVMKLDAGSDRLLKTINAPLVRSNITKIYSNYRKLNDVIIQSFFVGGTVENSKAEEIEDWIEIIGIIQPKLVQICGINRPPMDKTIKKVDEDTLYTIASKLKRRTQIECAVFL